MRLHTTCINPEPPFTPVRPALQILTEDYSKAAFLCTDRSVCLHARFGSYYKLRVPRFGRDIAYAPFTAELLVAGSAPEVCESSFGLMSKGLLFLVWLIHSLHLSFHLQNPKTYSSAQRQQFLAKLTASKIEGTAIEVRISSCQGPFLSFVMRAFSSIDALSRCHALPLSTTGLQN